MQPSWVGKQHGNDMKNQSNMNMDANAIAFAHAIANAIASALTRHLISIKNMLY